jgi:hypothetical protein
MKPKMESNTVSLAVIGKEVFHVVGQRTTGQGDIVRSMG